MSLWGQNHPYRQGRFYQLALGTEPLRSESPWENIAGGVRLRPVNFSQSLKKAQSANYAAILFSQNSALHPDLMSFVSRAQQVGLRSILQISSELFHSLWALRGDEWEASALEFEIILESVPRWTQEWDQLLQQNRLYFTLPGLRPLKIWKQLDLIPLHWYPFLHFYFPYLERKKLLFTPQEIVNFEKFFLKRDKDFFLRPPLGIDLYESRITETRDLEPLIDPVWQRRRSAQPKVSVVIPAYNNGTYLLNTLRHLQEQTLAVEDYEVIVVDDGSSDQTSEKILEFAPQYKGDLTVLYYPRSQKRSMGDGQFRAGLARNLGVRWARAPLLSFLDSDIIVPPHFLEKVMELHQSWDVVQWRRDYLSEKVDSHQIQYAGVQAAKDCFVPEEGYWHRFYTEIEKTSWGEVKDHWKYACTYAFSLPTQTFKDLGWFRKTYCFYGFEDTDLGWRLAQQGSRFLLHNEPVYHLFHETERSEFSNSFVSRQNLLRNTARIFFNNNLSPEIYRVFKYLLKDSLFF